jgi:plasmid maintenance system killer protein
MSQADEKLYDLISDLERLSEESFPVFFYKLIRTKELQRIIDMFPSVVQNEIREAHVILRKKEEILQDARIKADRIIANAESDRNRLLSESSILKDIEEKAQKFRQDVMEECEAIKMKAFNEAEGVRLDATQEAIKIREGAQNYAQNVLEKLEGDLNQLYQIVMNGQQYLSEMKTEESGKVPASPLLDLDNK